MKAGVERGGVLASEPVGGSYWVTELPCLSSDIAYCRCISMLIRLSELTFNYGLNSWL